jgi:hypothetical protein
VGLGGFEASTDRPIAITWKLETPLPTDFFNHASAIAQ